MGSGCAAIIVAAGTAQRMQGIDKVMAPIDGEPIILRAVRALAESALVNEIVIVTRSDLVQSVKELCAAVEKLSAVVAGGATRAESVAIGLDTISPELPFVAIHDGARPLVTVDVIDEAITAAEKGGAAAPAIPLHDTVKVAQNSVVLDTPDRSTLYAVQTPQVFNTEAIRAALRMALEQGIVLTDDCSAAEAAGMQVILTQGSEENLKVTTPVDLILAEAILCRREV